MKNTFKTLAALLIIGTAFTACTKEEAAPNTTPVKTLTFRDTLAGTWFSSEVSNIHGVTSEDTVVFDAEELYIPRTGVSEKNLQEGVVIVKSTEETITFWAGDRYSILIFTYDRKTDICTRLWQISEEDRVVTYTRIEE